MIESPVWLLGLIPWAGMVAYLLRGVGQRAVVPFLKLWPKPVSVISRPRLRLPPPWTLLMCAASLLAILAAAGPRWTLGAPLAADLSIVIDRGITMSGRSRYHELISKANELVGSRTAGAAITLIPVPGQPVVVTDGTWTSTAAAIPPAAIDTRILLQSTVTGRLRESTGPVMVLTDQPIGVSDARLIRVMPDRPARNVGITAFAARPLPRPQVMVRLTSTAPQSVVHLRVRSGTASVDRDVKFAGSDTEFLDMPPLADTVSAAIDSNDDIPADDAAWLTRQPTGITLDVAGGIAPEVRRMAAVFTRNRPVGRHVLVSDLPLPPGFEGIQCVNGTEAGHVPIVPLTTASDSLTTGVTAWPGPAANAKPPDGFRVVVERDHVPLVVVHDASPRQVWVNLDLSVWSRTTDFVVFFSNLFEFFRGDSTEEEFTSTTPVLLGPDWKRADDRKPPAGVSPGLWPGLYRSDDGRLLAVNAPLPPAEWNPGEQPAPLSRQPIRAVRPGQSLRPATCWVALLCVIAGVLSMRRRTAE